MIRRTIRRRGLLRAGAVVLPAALAGCGFRPLYAPDAFGEAGPGGEGLALVAVGLIPERVGQLLRQDLQQRLEGAGAPVEKRYDLQVLLSFSQEGIAILPDNSSSRVRYTAIAQFALHGRDPKTTLLTSGFARRIDAANVIDNQYFALDLETETVSRRLMAGLADQIALQLAAYFKNHPPSTLPAPVLSPP